MPVETGTYLPDLNPLYPYGSDTLAQGDDHLRLVKAVLKNTFKNFTSAPLNSTQAQIDGVVSTLSGILSGNLLTIPAGSTAGDGGHVILKGQGANPDLSVQNEAGHIAIFKAGTRVLTLDASGNLFVGTGQTPICPLGTIVLWAGSVESIPTGWHLCDGTAGTPNLKDRFVIGAGSAYWVGGVGGNNFITLSVGQLPSHSHGVNDPIHSHGISVTDTGHGHGVYDPGHTHGIPMGHSSFGSNGVLGSAGAARDGYADYTTDATRTGISIASSYSGVGVSIAGSNSGVTLQATGNGDLIDIRPPFYALCYIQRIA